MAAMKVAASTFPYLYSHSGLDALKHLHGMGYALFEMMIFPPHCWPRELSADDRKACKAWLDDTGTKITSFCYPLLDNNPNGVDVLMREYTLDRYREAIDLAAEWSCPYVVAIPGPVNSLINPPYQWMLDWFVEGMTKLVDHTKGTGVELLLENVPFTYLPTAEDMLKTADMISPEVGINFDVCNSAFIKEDVPGAIRLLGDRLKNVHISDTGYDEFLHAKLGTGVVDAKAAGAALQEIGYDKVTVLEIIADAMLPDTDPEADIPASHAILAEAGWEPLGS
ncbi:MAG: sugar phosphate isomerase/epimerase [Alphaproteobacteria bacterium]|nr:sugar phosphate isomerase/epimerase [Alphaproteobacteria bacterium]